MNTTDAQLARITVLLQAARLEVVGLKPEDYALRAEIMKDLNGLLLELRSVVTGVLTRHGLTLAPDHVISVELTGVRPPPTAA